jgi:anaphase-promoting complex subunit 8
MYFYALYYYRKAVKLRPGDARMWCALASCCAKLDRRDEAIRAYERAATAGDQVECEWPPHGRNRFKTP